MSEMLRKKISFCAICTVQMYCQASRFVCIAQCRCTARHLVLCALHSADVLPGISFCVHCTMQMYCQASRFVCIAQCRCTARHLVLCALHCANVLPGLFFFRDKSNLVFYGQSIIVVYIRVKRDKRRLESFLIMNGIASVPFEDLFVLMLLRVCVFRPKRYASVWRHNVHKNYSSCVEEVSRENVIFCMSFIFDTIFVLPDAVFSSGWLVLPFLIKMVWPLNWTLDNLGSAVQALLSCTLPPNSAVTDYVVEGAPLISTSVYWNCAAAVDCFYRMLFSALEQARCALVEWNSERVTVAFYSVLWISTKVAYLQHCLGLTWLVPRETVAITACSVYTIQPCTMSRHFMQSL